MNRNRPPVAMPAPGFQNSPFGGPPQGSQGPQGPQGQPVFAPECLEALIRQSESNYMIARDRTMKFDEASGALEMETQNMSIELANRGMGHALDPVTRAQAVIRQEMQAHRALLDAVLRSELALQGNFKRWVAGQMPTGSGPAPFGAPNGGPLPPPPPIPASFGQQQQHSFGQQQQQSPFQPQQGFAPPPPGVGQQQMPPPMPPGGVDYRDPRQAAEALLRAAPMPMASSQVQGAVQQPQPYPQQPQPYPQQQAAYPQPYPQQAGYPQPYPPYPQQPGGQQPQYAYPAQQQQQEVAPAQPPPMPTSMQFEQPLPVQQTPHQAAQPVNGAAKA